MALIIRQNTHRSRVVSHFRAPPDHSVFRYRSLNPFIQNLKVRTRIRINWGEEAKIRNSLVNSLQLDVIAEGVSSWVSVIGHPALASLLGHWRCVVYFTLFFERFDSSVESELKFSSVTSLMFRAFYDDLFAMGRSDFCFAYISNLNRVNLFRPTRFQDSSSSAHGYACRIFIYPSYY